MSLIKNTAVYLLLLVFGVKTITNEKEKLENCLSNIGNTMTESIDNSHLLQLIDQSTVILTAFCSENLIIFAEEDANKISMREKIYVDDRENEDDYYFYENNENEQTKILMTFTPETVFKGVDVLRKLQLFNNQEYFLIKG